ncbi:hypothetical protein [Zavarzinia sp. CC-PAN008]|uniref:hypothetical protein n=1 Tax=Zavarzinia sp. CC-PAN008 TaxID=3243332 RepID=UPI003F746D2D
MNRADRWAWAVLAALVAATLARGVVQAALAAHGALHYPFEIDYSEGTTAAQVLGLQSGVLYAPLGPEQLMAWCYAPVYLALAALADAGLGDILLAGRLVSLASAVLWSAVLGLVCLLATDGLARRPRLLGAVVAALSPWCFLPVRGWAPLMHVDFTAILLSTAGIACVLASPRRPGLLVPAVMLFLAALFTKQSALAAPLAASLAVAVHWPRRALACVLAAVALGAAGLGLIVAISGASALDHLFLYNTHGARLGRLGALVLLPVGLCLSLALVILWLRQAGAARGQPGAFPRLLLALYLATTALMTLGVMKIGANWNYTIEMLGVWAVIGGIMAARAWSARAAGTLPGPAAPVALSLLALVQLAFPWPDWQAVPDAQARADAAAVSAFVRTLPGPVLSEDPATLLHAGKVPVADIFLLSQLALAGMVPDSLIDAPIRAAEYGAIVVTSNSPEVWLPSTRDAIRTHYSLARTFGRYAIHVPAAR